MQTRTSVVRLMRYDGNTGPYSGHDQFFLFQKESAPGLDRDAAHFCFGRDGDGRGADDGHIEAHVLIRLGDFDDDRAFAGQSAAALHCFVRSLERFHRENGAVFHHHGLANVEPAHLFRDLEPKFDVGFFAFAERSAGDQSCRREQMFQEGEGREQLYSDAGEFTRDGAEKRFGIAALHSRQHEQGFPIRSQIEKVLRCDLTCHHGVTHLRFAKIFEETSELTDAKPLDLIDRFAQFRTRFVREGSGDKPFHARLARGLRQLERIRTVPGDNSESVRRGHKSEDALSRVGLLLVATPFDVQLRERFLQGGLDRSRFFCSVIFFHRRLRTRDRSFRRAFVDAGSFQREVG